MQKIVDQDGRVLKQRGEISYCRFFLRLDIRNLEGWAHDHVAQYIRGLCEFMHRNRLDGRAVDDALTLRSAGDCVEMETRTHR